MIINENTIGILLKYYNDTNCSSIISETLEKYVCDYDYSVSGCCISTIDELYNSLYNDTIKENVCYNYRNHTFDLDCYLVDTKYHIFVYVMAVLFAVIFFVSAIYMICYLINCRKHNEYEGIENRILIYKPNPIYEPYEE